MTTTLEWPQTRFPWRPLLLVVAVALVGRVLVLVSGAVSFHSDEAVIALMARHILQGERPVFFYGQAYMGSLDPWLVAIGFRLLGESVQTIRIVQAVLYLGVVASSFYAAWRLSGRALVATVAALTLALPPVLVAVYTSATLGGYNETLIFGNLLLALGYDVSHERRRSWGRWLLMGLVGGVAWWTNGLVVAFAAPVALLVFWRILRPLDDARPLVRRAAPLLLALAGFLIGSAPWWVFNFEHNFAALAFYTGGDAGQGYAGNNVPSLPFPQRVLGIFFLGLPTLIGLRFPWQPSYFAPLVGSLLVFIYLFALYRLARRTPAADGAPALKPDAPALLLVMAGLFMLIFFVSKFSIDSTGRYFLPMTAPFGIALGVLVVTIRLPLRPFWQIGLLALVLGYYVAGLAVAVSEEPGLTVQFNLDSHIPNTHDEELIAFLDEHELYSGYATYWVAFRLAFLSGERMQYSSALPYKPTLSYTESDERFLPYKAAADANPNPAYIIAKVFAVQERLEEIFAEQNLTYDRAVIGPYTVYYNVEPEAPRPPLPFAE